MISLVPSDRFSVTDPDEAVKLRMGRNPPENYDPITIPQLLNRCVDDAGDHEALKVKRNGKWISWTYSEYKDQVVIAAKSLLKLGLEELRSVCIIGFNSPEWFFADLAAIYAGGMGVGIYPTNNVHACQYILQNSRCNVVVVEDDKQLRKVLAIDRRSVPELKAIVQYSGDVAKDITEDVLNWNEFMKLGRSNDDEDISRELELRLNKIAANKCCQLVYTSGTTGDPKGVMLSHDNLTYTGRIMTEAFNLATKEERFVSFLPLSHVAALMLDMYVGLSSRSTVYFADKSALKGTLVDTLKEALPTIFLAVPRVWEKFQERMTEVGRRNKGLKREIGTWAKRTGFQHHKNLLSNSNHSKSLKFKLADKLVFQKVKAALGLSKTKLFFAVGAPMSIETIEYFMSLDIMILEIYGMSEVCGPQTGNLYGTQEIGSIGKTIKGFHTMIGENGEIYAQGRNTMMGYIFNPTETEKVFTEDGWLKSGDMGSVDSNGFFRLTGRIKEIIITSGGENVPFLSIEDELKTQLPCLSNVMVIGDRRKFLSCLLTFKVEEDPDTLEPSENLTSAAIAWCESIGSKSRTIRDILDSPDDKVMEAIQLQINKYNEISSISNAQKIQKWKILRKDFSLSGGELGPTLKIKRHFVLEKYSAIIDHLYS